MRNILIGLMLAVSLTACATTPEGEPDCKNADNQRAAILAGREAALIVYNETILNCKEGEEGDKCRRLASSIYSGAVAASNVALVVLNSRCPPVIAGPPGQ